MQRSNLIFTLLGFGIWALGFNMGCGQQESATTTTTLPSAAGSITVSGSLYSGVVSATSVKAAGARALSSADTPISDYQVVAVGTEDKKVYFPDSKTDANGNFTISNLPSGESFYLEIIDSNQKFVAPVSFGVAGDAVVMAITNEAGGDTINLGKIAYDDAKGVAAPTTEVFASQLDEGSTARAKSAEDLVPVGAGNLGRGTGEAYFTGTLEDKVDEDDDGLPDIVDIDDDGDGKVDGLDSVPRRPGATETARNALCHSNTFANLPMNYENYPTYIGGSLNNSPINVRDNTILAIEVVMEPGNSPDLYSDVRIVEGPAWLETAKVSGSAALWKDSDYRLEKESSRWDIHVVPNGTPEAGDVLKFQVTKTSDGSKEYFISTLTFVFTDIPRLIAYSDSGSPATKEGVALNLLTYQAKGNKFEYTGNSVSFTFTAPKDDLGSYISGMNYYLDGINYYNASGGVIRSAGSIKITPDEVSHPAFGTVYKTTFTPTTEAFDSFKVDVKAQSPLSGGGNASQLINFRKI